MTEQTRIEGRVRVAWSASYVVVWPESAPPPAGFPVLMGLHGFGDDHGRLAERLNGLGTPPYALLYPNGPFPVEMRDERGLRVGHAWYQYTGDQSGFMESLAFAEDHLDRVLNDATQRAPIDPSRVVLLGYSQGGYLASVAALRNPARYRGLIAIACRIKTEALAGVLSRRAGYPVLVLHGRRDSNTPLERQQQAVEELRRQGFDVTFHVHDGGHGLRTELVPLIDAFVRRITGA